MAGPVRYEQLSIISMRIKRFIVVVLFMTAGCLSLWGQDSALLKRDTVRQIDVTDIIRKILKKGKPPPPKPGSRAIAILPSLGYNPSFGFIIGATITGGMQFGDPQTTSYSVFTLEGMYTSKGILSVQAKHNIFVANNKWNWQGQWQLAHYGLIDYGIGTGTRTYKSGGVIVGEYPTKNADSAFPIQYSYVRLSEKAYRKIGKHFFVGGG